MAKENEKLKILYVEDINIYANDWKSRFQEMGYDVVLAPNAEEAIKIFKNDVEEFHIAFVDLGLPPEPDLPDVGLNLLSKFREERPDMGLVAYSNLAENAFNEDIIANLISSQISFVPIRFGIRNEEIKKILELVERGFVIYPPGLTPKFKNIVINSRTNNPLDNWLYYLLSLLATKTIEEVDNYTGVPINTIRSDIDEIYRILENEKLIPKKTGTKRNNSNLIEAYYDLYELYGEPKRTDRPKRRTRFRKLRI